MQDGRKEPTTSALEQRSYLVHVLYPESCLSHYDSDTHGEWDSEKQEIQNSTYGQSSDS